jgi:hypothetical protein
MEKRFVFKSLSQRPLRLAAAAALAAGFVAVAAPAASANDGDVIAEGPCSGGSDWKLKASPENGQIEIEWEVDSNVVGQRWKFTIAQNGTTIASGRAVTKAPSGSFEVNRVTANQAGNDVFTATASLRATGETCSGSVTFTA